MPELKLRQPTLYEDAPQYDFLRPRVRSQGGGDTIRKFSSPRSFNRCPFYSQSLRSVYCYCLQSEPAVRTPTASTTRWEMEMHFCIRTVDVNAARGFAYPLRDSTTVSVCTITWFWSSCILHPHFTLPYDVLGKTFWFFASGGTFHAAYAYLLRGCGASTPHFLVWVAHQLATGSVYLEGIGVVLLCGRHRRAPRPRNLRMPSSP